MAPRSSHPAPIVAARWLTREPSGGGGAAEARRVLHLELDVSGGCAEIRSLQPGDAVAVVPRNEGPHVEALLAALGLAAAADQPVELPAGMERPAHLAAAFSARGVAAGSAMAAEDVAADPPPEGGSAGGAPAAAAARAVVSTGLGPPPPTEEGSSSRATSTRVAGFLFFFFLSFLSFLSFLDRSGDLATRTSAAMNAPLEPSSGPADGSGRDPRPSALCGL